ncbi:MAG: orotidine-5'-phosphate decarboxylase [Firmicutes bacterium]|nr:orotidine-5'-phosphate decarboxylase [Bacillota bacterium]
MGKDVIVACDFSSAEETLRFLSAFHGRKPYIKIGMELYYSAGPDIVYKAKEMGCRVFLDLKLHDIPNTVKKTAAVLSRLEVDMTNLHAAGGSQMMRGAAEEIKSAGGKTLLIAVTQLTSTGDEMLKNELLIGAPMEDVVASYAKNAMASGLDGVVCSPLEAGRVHTVCSPSFLTVTPGVRFDEASRGDQTRIATPARAKVLGSDYIVVGRPITAAADPVAAYERCVADFVD